MRHIILFLIVIIGFVAYFLFSSSQKQNEVVEETQTIELCFYKERATESGFSDKAWLTLSLQGDAVSGEFYNLPAQTDSKVGEFAGTVSQKDPYSMSRTIDAWWEARAEGTIVTEELRIVFGEGTASVGFSEMVDRGDGVYIYKDKDAISYWQELYDVSCDDLNDRILVEAYVRENISSIISEEPVLGGSWYVVSLSINPAEDTGEVVFEDGHIQGSASFQYSIENNKVSIISLVEA